MSIRRSFVPLRIPLEGHMPLLDTRARRLHKQRSFQRNSAVNVPLTATLFYLQFVALQKCVTTLRADNGNTCHVVKNIEFIRRSLHKPTCSLLPICTPVSCHTKIVTSLTQK